jgi:arylsulfatase A-like enzyme
MKSKIIPFIFAVFFGFFSVLEASKSPNILWIFCDDMAVNALGAYQSHFSPMNLTPNIDQIAEKGMRFDKFYVGNSICAPSRATLLTGKHSHKNGKYGNIEDFNHDQMQFQKLLKEGGYQSALIGKTHLKGELQGFDYWETLPGHGKYINPKFKTAKGLINTEGHSTDVITNHAMDWLLNKRNKESPFILMVHYKAPHRNWTPAQRFVDKFKDTSFPEPNSFMDTYQTREMAKLHNMGIKEHMKNIGDLKADKWAHRSKLLDKNIDKNTLARLKYQAYMQDYFGCVAGVDENVGRLLDEIEEQGLTKNTVVMFSSDQGFYLGEHGWFDKRWMYEESFRTPLIVKWPGIVKAGSVNTDLGQNIDFAPTFLDLAGVEIPNEMQGESLVPLLKSETPEDWRSSLYYHYYMDGGHGVTRHEGVSDGNFKLIRFYGSKTKGIDNWELFNLKKDPSELNNIYSKPEYSTNLKKMHLELQKLRDYYEVPDEEVVMVKRKK